MKTLKEVSRNEVLARSLAATVSFAILATILFFTNFQNASLLFYDRVACVLIIVANIWRGALYFKWKRTQSVSEKIWNQFHIANVLNSMNWGTALVLVIHQNESSPLTIALVLLMAVGLTNASILTLGYAAKLHATFVLLTLCPITGLFFHRYSKTQDTIDLTIACIFIVAIGYILSQARIYRRRFAEKVHADNALIASQQALIEQRAMTEHANRLASLGEMAAGFAHEINNPLTIVAGNLELIQAQLEKEQPDSPLINHIAKALTSSVRITKIVKSLRTLSYRTNEETRSRQNISNIVRDTVELYTDRLSAQNINFTASYQDLTVVCDPIQIAQVLLNLLNNAKDAVASLPDVDRWIQLDVSVKGNFVIVSVSNGGQPITEELQLKIFTPFFTTKPVGEGMGLGLAISRSIARRHDGDLELTATDGHTCFRLSLPLAS